MALVALATHFSRSSGCKPSEHVWFFEALTQEVGQELHDRVATIRFKTPNSLVSFLNTVTTRKAHRLIYRILVGLATESGVQANESELLTTVRKTWDLKPTKPPLPNTARRTASVRTESQPATSKADAPPPLPKIIIDESQI